jgi:predicted dehydrogenase
VWDQDGARGRQFAEKLGVPYEPDYQKVLDNPGIDAVMIEAETNLHTDLIVRAARAKKHVFTDKILTPTVADGLKIRDDTALRIVAISEAAYESARNGGRPQEIAIIAGIVK